MFHIGHDLLRELGLGGLPRNVRNDLVRHIHQTLELRVGQTLAGRMSLEQLNEFEALDEAGSLTWLERNFPDYRATVFELFEQLKAEIRRDAAAIIASVEP